MKNKLDGALATGATVLRGEGLTETRHIHPSGATLYTEIKFRPYYHIGGYFCGYMFYPENKAQGEMDFGVESFVSVEILSSKTVPSTALWRH